MPCKDCQNNNPLVYYPQNGCSNCNPVNPDCDMKIDASCVSYTGAALTCSSAPTNTNLETILQIMDAKICSVTGDFTGYNFFCLGPFTTEKEFVEGISKYVCDFKDEYNSFVTVTYENKVSELQTQIDNINGQRGINSCSSLGITPSDDLQTVLEKLSNGTCDIIEFINPSTANWNQCFTVSGNPPSTIVEGFNSVISMICSVKASIPSGGGTLPTFDNTGTCLSSPTTSDSLVDTVIKIRSRLCLTPTFDAANLTASSCVQFSGSSSLEQVIDAQNNQISQTSQQSIRAVSADFVLTPIDVNTPCLGQRISLNGAVVDRKVASNASDSTPGTLQDKLVAGNNVDIDFSTTPGKVIISSTGGGITSDEKVKATALDPLAGYLVDKIVGTNTGIVTIGAAAPSPDKVTISANLDLDALIDAILTEFETNPTIKARICALVASCPVQCAAPTNASVSFQTT